MSQGIDQTNRGRRTGGRGVGNISTHSGGKGVVSISGRWGGHCYDFLGRPKVEASNAMIIGIILICHRPASMLFDPGFTYYYMSTYFSLNFHLPYDTMFVFVYVSTPISEPLVVDQVYQSYLVILSCC